MRATMESLCQLWKLMDLPEEEKRQFSKVMSILILPEEGITSSGVLSQELIDKVQPLCCSLFRSLNVIAYCNHSCFNFSCRWKLKLRG